MQMQQAHYACCMFTYSSQETKLLRKKTCSGVHASWGHRKDLKGAFQTSLLLSVDAHIQNDRNHTNKSKNCSTQEGQTVGRRSLSADSDLKEMGPLPIFRGIDVC